MSQTLHIDDAVLVNRTSNQDIILQGNLLLVDFAITMLVEQFIYRPQIWVPLMAERMPKKAQTTAQLHSSHTLVK